ncbi:MAG: VOC family protein [Longimicrobiales bacterium]
MTLTTQGFHHITMVSSNAPRTVRFYRDVLGLVLVKRTVNFDDPGSYHLYFGDARGAPGTLLTFFEWRNVKKGHWGVGGVHHLALGVATEDAQLKWKRRLEDAGVAVSGPYDRGWFHSIYFADPDGQILEIATRGPGYTLDEPVDALGQSVIQPKPSQMRGQRDEPAIRARTWPEPVTAISDDMRLEGIHHITGITDDIERAHDFYEEALGLRLVKKSVNQDDGRTPHWFWARYDGKSVTPGSSYTLFDWRNSTYFSRPGVGQTHHIAFRASSDEEQAAWRDHLATLAVEVTPVQDRAYFRSIYFRAPDGQLLEIATDGPGFAIDEDASQLGHSLRLPPWLEPRRAELEESLVPLP